MPLYVIPQQPSFGEQVGRGLAEGINNWLDRKEQERIYQQQVATELAARERLMEIAHKQKMQEMAYKLQLDNQKKATVHYQKIESIKEIGPLQGSVILCSVIAILFVAGIFTVIAFKPNE